IPAGRLTAVMPLYSHYMPEYWTRPTLFDPERFSAERREDKSHRFAWEPFGGGVHKCLGMIFAGLETKLVISALLRHFEWSVPRDRPPGFAPPLGRGRRTMGGSAGRGGAGAVRGSAGAGGWPLNWFGLGMPGGMPPGTPGQSVASRLTSPGR